MKIFRDILGVGRRPYPLDPERRRRALTALAERGMTMSDLARALNVKRSLVSNTISGRRKPEKTERLIAEYLGKPEGWLFPPRTAGDIKALRRAEAERKGEPA